MASAALGLHETWNEKKLRLNVEHEKELAFHNKLFEKEKEKLHEENGSNLERLKATVPSSLYQDLISPMAEKALSYDLQQIEIGHKRRTEIITKAHKDEHARQEIAYREELRVNMAVNMAQTKQSPPATEDSGMPQHKDVSVGPDGSEKNHQSVPLNSLASPNPVQQLKLTKPLICTVQPETINGAQRLMMHVQTQPKKRKASASEELPPKRPHLDTTLDTAVNSLHTPVSPPLNEPSQQPERTITFDEVYQNGNAEHKHTIVEWPVNSKKWYILKCDQHRRHFTQNPVPGAARHLNSVSHGFPDRNRNSAVKTLGYRVVDCDETQVRLHNEMVNKAYENGYIPVGYKGKPENIRRRQQPNGKVSEGASTSRTTDLGPAQENVASERPPTEDDQERKEGITHPKVFHIYYGHWKVNGCKSGQIYPVMILGWDEQKGSGLDNTNLHDTGLLKKTSQPPNCYKYDSKKIIGWAPGYEDGGSKVEQRRFPVMFFDESQTVAWFPAADLFKFPLYKRKAPERPDDPFNAARRWIAEREGFETWEDREKSRLNALEARPQSSYSKTSAENPLENPDPLADSDDWDSYSESEAASTGTTETEKMMKKLREKGGEIPGDDDYSASASDIDIDDKEIDDNLDFEVEAWNRATSSSDKTDSASNRPWAFYQLRGKDGSHETERAADTQETHAAQESHEVQEGHSMTFESTGMGSAHRLAMQACYSPNSYSSLTDSQTHNEKPTHDVNSQDITGATRGERQPEISTPTADGDSFTSLHCQHQAKGGTKGKSDLEEEKAWINDMTPEFSSSRVSLPHPSFNKANSNETLDSRKDRLDSVPVTPDAQNVGEPLFGNIEQILGEETQETSSSTAPCSEPTAPAAAPAAHVEFANNIADANPDYELSLFSNGGTSWKKSNEDEDFVKLFYSADRKKAATRWGPVTITVDPMEIDSFSREPIPGLNGNSILVMKNKCGSSWRVVFDRNKQSKLENGKIQARGFIRWLRSVNPDIKCLGS
ncbi:hypothetical protein F4818DRAFT_391438 [Hypoxylon cercidicola]|nr:hypothetical protein F4818DRAFT_391438 [Hypoxylon cercidicola]